MNCNNRVTMKTFLETHITKDRDNCWSLSTNRLPDYLRTNNESNAKRAAYKYYTHESPPERLFNKCGNALCANPNHITDVYLTRQQKVIIKKISSKLFWALDDCKLLNWRVEGDYPVYVKNGVSYYLGFI